MNPYKTLSITSVADDAVVKKAYKCMAQAWHPDKNDGDDVMFKSIKEAYNILSDPIRRAHYDQTGEVGEVPDIEAIATARLDDLFDHIITAGGRNDEGELVKSMTDGVRAAIQRVKVDIANITHQIEHLEKLKGKVTVIKGVENRFDMRLQLAISHNNGKLLHSKTEMDAMEFAITMLDAYDDTSADRFITNSWSTT